MLEYGTLLKNVDGRDAVFILRREPLEKTRFHYNKRILLMPQTTLYIYISIDHQGSCYKSFRKY